MNNKTKNLISWSVIFVLIFGAIALIEISRSGKNSEVTSFTASAVSASENSFDFGRISMKGGDVSHMFEFVNQGDEPIQISKVYTSCMCTEAYVINSRGEKYGAFGMPGHGGPSLANIEIASGEIAFVEAIFDPAAHGPSGVGLAERSIYLETNSTESPKLEFFFLSIVIPEL